jgi:Uncharacterized protein conserved in bacteria
MTKGTLMSDPNAQPPVDPASGQPQQPSSAPQQPYGQQPGQSQQPYAQQPQQPYAQQPQQPYAQPAPAGPLTAEQDKNWAMWSHIGGVIGPIPVLIIWLVFKDRGPRTNVEGKEALNWQITFTIGYVVLWILVSIISAALWFTFLPLILWLLPFAWWVINVVFSIQGGMAVNNGGSYRYPWAIRFIK